MIVLEFTDAERDAMIIWAGMAGVGFGFGLVELSNDPGVTALKKLEASQLLEAPPLGK